MLTFPIDDLVAWLPSDTRFTFYVPLADDDERCQVWHVETSEARQVAAEVTKAAEMRAPGDRGGLGTKSQKGRRDTKHSIMASLSSFKMLAVEGIDDDDDDEGEEGASAGAGTSASHGAAADDDDDDDVRKFAVTVVVGNRSPRVHARGELRRDGAARRVVARAAAGLADRAHRLGHAAADEFRFYVAATRDQMKFKRGALTCASADAAEQIATLLTAIARAIAEDDGDDGYIEGEPPATRDVGGGRGAVNAAGTLEAILGDDIGARPAPPADASLHRCSLYPRLVIADVDYAGSPADSNVDYRLPARAGGQRASAAARGGVATRRAASPAATRPSARSGDAPTACSPLSLFACELSLPATSEAAEKRDDGGTRCWRAARQAWRRTVSMSSAARGSGSRPPTGTRTRPPSARRRRRARAAATTAPLDGGRQPSHRLRRPDRRPARRRRAAADARPPPPPLPQRDAAQLAARSHFVGAARLAQLDKVAVLLDEQLLERLARRQGRRLSAPRRSTASCRAHQVDVQPLGGRNLAEERGEGVGVGERVVLAGEERVLPVARRFVGSM